MHSSFTTFGARRLSFALACIAGLSSCSDGGGAPSLTPGALSSIVITPATLSLEPGESGDLEAAGFSSNGAAVSLSAVTWSTNQAGTATVSSDGRVTAVAAGTATITARSGSIEGQATVTVTPPPPTGLVVDVHPAVTHQTMTGWEAVTQIGELECNPTAFQIYRGPLLDAAVNDLGINRLRLQVRSGAENPVDWFTKYRNQEIDRTTFRAHWWEIINDNADPRSANPAGFQWSLIDYTIDNVVTPMRQRLAARGERLYVNLNYVDFGLSSFEHSSNPDEYAELILATFQHINQKYGWVPDAVEISLEPDNSPNWRASTMGPAVVATGDRLAAAGFHPDFIAPSTTNMSTAIPYFDEMILMPRVREYLTDLAYHRYSGVSTSALQAIGDRAAQYGIRTGMLEHIGSGHEDLHDDLLIGRNSSWEQFALAFCTSDNGAQYYTIDQSNPSAPKVAEGSRTRFLKQYFRHVRLGAVRVGAVSGDSRFSPLAFRNTDGRFVVVIKGPAGTLQVRGLPAGAYGSFYANASQSGVSPDVTIGGQQPLTVTMPAGGGVVTVYRK